MTVLHCPECDTGLSLSVEESTDDLIHLLEYCPMCGYAKSYIDYLESE